MRCGYWYSPLRLAGQLVPDGAAGVVAELEAGAGLDVAAALEAGAGLDVATALEAGAVLAGASDEIVVVNVEQPPGQLVMVTSVVMYVVKVLPPDVT